MNLSIKRGHFNLGEALPIANSHRIAEIIGDVV